ncbi:hypothetical protein CSV79_11435 [Sporosarcina sp. P13]|uniref:hypothetical protein n=1 Tax=Sporosarcina sp. P13 TaxID=2048263 RepID=UPI000C173370|nr:hypothetical protein [Sporosarcina sp. P13]PIC63484.1 hypothetical protein CSV79_11435 [Sporosarcina sp. P13]
MVDPSMASIFSEENKTALQGAIIEFKVEGNKATKLTALTLNHTAGSEDQPIIFDGKNAEIDGSMVLAGGHYTVKNVHIKGDFIITSQVKNNFTAHHMIITGTTYVKEESNTALTRSSHTEDENLKPRFTVMFNDSTIAVIVIARKDTNFTTIGGTTMTELILQENAFVSTDENVVLPKVRIGKGATRVELNATIKDVIIDSTNEVTIVGHGNFENVMTNTKNEIILEMSGRVKNLDARNGKLTVWIGHHLLVGKVLVATDMDVKDIVSNYKNSQAQIGGVTDKVDYFEASLLRVMDRFGYVKLNLKNQGSHRVMYELVKKRTKNLTDTGEKVPTNAVVYTAEEEFIAWDGYEVHVYQVDESSKIVDAISLDIFFQQPIRWRVTDDGYLQIKTTFHVGEKSIADEIQFIYLYSDKKVEKFTDFSNIKWEMEDGLKTLNLKLSQPNNPKENLLLFFSSDYSTMEGWSGTGDRWGTPIFMLHDAAADNNLHFTWHFVSMIKWFNHQAKTDTVSMETYKTELITNKEELQSFESISAMIDTVNDRLQSTLDSYQHVRNLVSKLLVADYDKYKEKDRLRAGVTQEDISDALANCEALEDHELLDKKHLMMQIMYAQELFDSM